MLTWNPGPELGPEDDGGLEASTPCGLVEEVFCSVFCVDFPYELLYTLEVILVVVVGGEC